MIPTRFTWPHGGKRVFLTGSFTRWVEHLQMIPLECYPNIFQVICNLTPGLHQYKFYVDGEWRHDEQQPFVMGTYGIVNTIHLTMEPDSMPATFSPGASSSSSRMSMDVDEAFHRVVTVSDGAMKVATLSEADLRTSRDCISKFLSSHTAYDLLPDSGKVIALDVCLPVKQAFNILYEQGMSLAPLWDEKSGQFVGVLSALDFILMLQELGSHGLNLTEEELESHTISAWKEIKQLRYRPDDQEKRHLVHAGPHDSLKDVAVMIVQKGYATVPIIYSSAQDGSYPQLLHLASLSGILRCICRHFRYSSSSLPILQQPICTIPLGTWVPQIGVPNGHPLFMLRREEQLSSALSLLVQAQVSSIPIVDENDCLVDTYSRSDITALAKDKAYAHTQGMTIYQALQLGQEANSPYRYYNGQRCQMCLRTDPLQKVMECLANPGVRRVIIVEAGSNRVEGIVSLTDVFRLLLG